MDRTAFVDYQNRAREFCVGQSVVLWGGDDTRAGRVTAVWPGIGMVDVEWPWGNTRQAVEDLQILKEDHLKVQTPRTNSVAGGPTYPFVSGGPAFRHDWRVPVSVRVASRYLGKKGWG